jgi:hypothetical protein
MNTTGIYEEYSKTLNSLSELQLRYRFSAPDEVSRTAIQQRIRESQEHLSEIIQEMIHVFPYLDTKRTGQGMLNE